MWPAKGLGLAVHAAACSTVWEVGLERVWELMYQDDADWFDAWGFDEPGPEAAA